MFQKVCSLFLALMLTLSLAACGNGDSEPATAPAAGSTDSGASQVENTTAQPTAPENPSADQPITCFKDFQYKTVDDADYSQITLQYREGSDYVATITGTIQVPKASEAYSGALEKNTAFEGTVKALGLPEEIMWFLHSQVNLENGYTKSSFTFAELDASNFANAALVGEYIGFATENGYLNLSQCEQALLGWGYVLTNEA